VRRALALLVAVRVAVPLAVLAASPGRVPALPRVRFDVGGGCGGRGEPWTGDACAYYSTARALVAGWRSLGAAPLALLTLAVLAGLAVALRLWRSRPARRPQVAVAVALGLALVAAACISQVPDVPAGAVGWPLLWSLPLVPLRALHAAGPKGAFAAGLALSLLANAATVVATAYAGLGASGRRSVALVGAALFALWPLLVGGLAGTRSWQNGTWEVDAGLHLYTEPVSTALVAVALALALARTTALSAALAGIALGCAAAVRPTNALAGLVVLVYVAVGRRRGAAPLLAGALALVPVVAAFWPKKRGYELRPVNDSSGAPLFGGRYAGSSWGDSLLWGPRTLAVLLPVAALGALALPRRAALLLLGVVLSNALVYTFAAATAQHPRYLFAGLPALLVLWAAGADALVRAAVVRLRHV
jgi:hypothetical protein